MKRMMFLVLSVVALVSLSGYKTVKHPQFDFRNRYTLDIESIDITDSATIFHIKAYEEKPWKEIKIVSDTYIYIRAGAYGEKLMVTRSEGILLDEEFSMPDSGEHSFTLYFPPIDPKTKKIDFIGSDGARCFNTYGIELVPSKVRTEMPAITGKPQADEPYGANIISDKKATYKGRFIGYEPRYFDKFILLFTSPMAAENMQDVPVAPDGSFSIDLDIYVPSVAWITGVGIDLYFAYLEPGEETIQYIDLKTYTNSVPRFSVNYGKQVKYIYNDGSLARINDGLEKIKPFYSRFLIQDKIRSNEKIGEMSPNEYKAFINKIFDEAIADVDTIPDFPKKLSAYLNVGINAERIDMLKYYQNNVMRVRMKAANESDWTKMQDYMPARPDEDYYDFYNYLDLNSELNLTIRPTNRLIMSIAESFVNQEYPNVEKALDNPELIKLIGSDHGPFYDIVRYKYNHAQYSTLPNFSDDTIPAAKLQELKKEIGNPVLMNKIITDNQKIIDVFAKKKLKSGYVMNETPNVPNEQLLSSILDKYKGKVVFVHFWEIWCGQCKSAIEMGEPVKDELKDKDVVFLYLAGYPSQQRPWKNKIMDIRGEHFYPTDSQMTYLKEKFGITGNHSYLLIDKKGEQKSSQVEFMGPERMKSMIVEQLLK